jgi:excisionase family DNA binding protein
MSSFAGSHSPVMSVQVSTLRTNPPLIMNERELAVVLDVCVRTVRNLVRDGTIPRIKLGRRVVFRWPQVEAALAALESVEAGA